MTIWEALFGTPERAAKTLNEMQLIDSDYCDMMDALSRDQDTKCRNCAYEYVPYECEPRDMKYIEWLNSEVVE